MARYGWRPYVPAARRRARASREIARLRKSGHEPQPIRIEGRKIARTFWGSAWCDNLEAYSDYANRLPRGRTYVRNGSVIDLQIAGGRITALVSGSEFYEVTLGIRPLAVRKWRRIRSQCAGRIDSLVELLQGRLSDAVMDIVTRPREGLFPAPREISLSCSCPDWATMCKHVAAVLYGVGARLDHAPELLFALRGVDPAELVADAVGRAGTKSKPGRGRVLAEDDLSAVFGVDIDTGAAAAAKKRKSVRRRRAASGKKATKKKATKKKATKKKAAKTASKKRPKKRKPPSAAAPMQASARLRPGSAG